MEFTEHFCHDCDLKKPTPEQGNNPEHCKNCEACHTPGKCILHSRKDDTRATQRITMHESVMPIQNMFLTRHGHLLSQHHMNQESINSETNYNQFIQHQSANKIAEETEQITVIKSISS